MDASTNIVALPNVVSHLFSYCYIYQIPCIFLYEFFCQIRFGQNIYFLAQFISKTKCFTGTSTVTLENGELKRMSDLNVGDSVLTVDNNNALVFSPIILDLHRSSNGNGEFLVIQTNQGHSITLSPQHLLYSRQQDEEANDLEENNENKMVDIKSFPIVFASNVKIGDFVLVHNNYKSMTSGVVVQIEEMVISKGLYSPLTYQGNIVVDNVLASCYSDFDSHELQHFAFSPFRLIHRLMEFIPSVEIKLDADNGIINQEDDVVFWYGQGLHAFSHVMFPRKLWE